MIVKSNNGEKYLSEDDIIKYFEIDNNTFYLRMYNNYQPQFIIRSRDGTIFYSKQYLLNGLNLKRRNDVKSSESDNELFLPDIGKEKVKLVI